MPKVNVPVRLVRTQIASRALVEERTIKKFFGAPHSVRPAIAAQIRKALAELGFADPRGTQGGVK